MKTTDGNAASHFIPPVFLHELIDDGFKRDAVQRVAGVGNGIGHKFKTQRGLRYFLLCRRTPLLCNHFALRVGPSSFEESGGRDATF